MQFIDDQLIITLLNNSMTSPLYSSSIVNGRGDREELRQYVVLAHAYSRITSKRFFKTIT